MSLPELPLSTLRHLVGDDALYQRGIELAEKGAVTGSRRGDLLLAHVQGSEPLPYSVTLEPPATPRARKWGVLCTCPYYEIHDRFCKHIIAVFYLWATQPEQFTIEPTLDEALAGMDRAHWLGLIQESLNNDPTISRLLSLPPERARPLRRALHLKPYEEQLRFAFLPKHDPAKQAQLAGSLLESAAGYQRIGDSPNAIRIGSLLAEQLIEKGDKTFEKLLLSTLALLELAAIEPTPPLHNGAGSKGVRFDEERGTWLGRVFVWWGMVADNPVVAGRLLDLILHSYTPTTEAQVITWLRAQLRRPIHANQKSQHGWRARIRTFLLAYYEARQDDHALLDLSWEEGDDRRAAITLARQGDTAETIALARSGLGDATTHRMVAELLAAQGYTEAATTVAEAGRGYQDRGRAALLTWLAQAAWARGERDKTYQDALAAWRITPTAERYRLMKASAPTSERVDSFFTEAPPDMKVEILIAENQWKSAAALLPESGMRRAELTETLARALIDVQPERAIEHLFDLADLHARIGTRAGYYQAARALLAAQTVAFSQHESLKFASLLQQFRITHHRKSKLLSSLAESGIL
jgi:hypothetical protein